MLLAKTVMHRLRCRRPLCNGRPHTAIEVGGVALPLCARCSGVVFGCLAAVTVATVTTVPALSPAVAAIFCVPCIVDGLRSYKRLRGTSNNTSRFISGTLLGACLTIFLR